MTTARRLHHWYADYLRALERSEVKLEFCDGEIYALAGGAPAHAALSAAVVRELSVALKGRGVVYSSDLKVRVEASDLSTFPDVSVVCGDRKVSAIDENAVTNPTILVEVTSRSTEDYDRGHKLSHYKQLPSLRAVLLVSHRARRVTLVQRASSGWDELEFQAGETVELFEPACAIAVDAVYDGLGLEPGT
ncbi:MAG: hypothetical protein AMXMBFR34_28030 [Myxococcaceae bacterium]